MCLIIYLSSFSIHSAKRRKNFDFKTRSLNGKNRKKRSFLCYLFFGIPIQMFVWSRGSVTCYIEDYPNVSSTLRSWKTKKSTLKNGNWPNVDTVKFKDNVVVQFLDQSRPLRNLENLNSLLSFIFLSFIYHCKLFSS